MGGAIGRVRPRRGSPGASPPARSGGGRFVVITGLSGSGKSQAIRALEDLGYFCVDNLPTMLIPTLAQLSLREGTELPKVAIVVDVREGAFLSQFPRVWRRLQRMRGLNPTLIFLEASHAALVRRFSETRRPHPLAPDRSVSEGIAEERSHLDAIRGMADEIVDTSELTVHELRSRFMTMAREKSQQNPLVVTLLSFGFKHGVPLDADLVFDVRFLPNPHFVPELKPLTGRDRAVVRFMRQHDATGQFLEKLTDMLQFLVPQYVVEGKSYLTIAIGCTGGRHRSVFLAEALRPVLATLQGVRARVRHRDTELGA
jgi:RNase adapter protein RapZ